MGTAEIFKSFNAVHAIQTAVGLLTSYSKLERAETCFVTTVAGYVYLTARRKKERHT